MIEENHDEQSDIVNYDVNNWWKKEKKEYEKKIAKLEKQNEELNSRITQQEYYKQRYIRNFNSLNNEYKSKNEELQNKFEELQNKYESYIKKLQDEHKSEKEKIVNENFVLQKRNEKIISQNSKLLQEVSKLKTKLALNNERKNSNLYDLKRIQIRKIIYPHLDIIGNGAVYRNNNNRYEQKIKNCYDCLEKRIYNIDTKNRMKRLPKIIKHNFK